jgi:hypothetical protein
MFARIWKTVLTKMFKWLYANYVGWEKLVLRKPRNFTFHAILLHGWGVCCHERCHKYRPAWHWEKLKGSFARLGYRRRSVCVCVCALVCICIFMTRQPLEGYGLLIVEASRSHSDTSHWVGIPWASDQPHAETCTWQHTTLTTDRHPCPLRDSNS